MVQVKLSPYQEKVVAYLKQNKEAYYGFANLRSLIVLQKKGLIKWGVGTSDRGAWMLTPTGEAYLEDITT